MCGKSDPDLRARAGFRSSEFSSAKFVSQEPTIEGAKALLNARADRLHAFTAYHGSDFFEALISEAVKLEAQFFIAAEAPQNMQKNVLRRMMKEVWIPTLLRWRVRRSVANSLFFVCYSGEATSRLHQVGWPRSKIEPFGYYPPNLASARPDLVLPERLDATRDAPLHFLATGMHDDHKSPMTMVEAAKILKAEGLGNLFHCTIAGQGKQSAKMHRAAQKSGLPIVFPGFVSLEELIYLYRRADVFVGTGGDEPWGIRINDAIMLGCPAICSTGMGAYTEVMRYNSGWAYESGSPMDLARVMRKLIEDRDAVQKVNRHLTVTSDFSPEIQGQRLLQIIEHRFSREAA